jgi:hypothetical protein
MITEARIRTSGFDVNLAVGQLAQLPYRDQSFDVILALGVLEYLLTPTANNTAATAITLNGNAATPIEDAFGSDLASGSLIVGNTALMFWSTDHSGLLIAAAVDGNAFLADAQTAATPDERAPHARLLRLSHTNSNQEDFSRAKPSASNRSPDKYDDASPNKPGDQITNPAAEANAQKTKQPIGECCSDDSQNDVHQDSGATSHEHFGQPTGQPTYDNCSDPTDFCFWHYALHRGPRSILRRFATRF